MLITQAQCQAEEPESELRSASVIYMKNLGTPTFPKVRFRILASLKTRELLKPSGINLLKNLLLIKKSLSTRRNIQLGQWFLT